MYLNRKDVFRIKVLNRFYRKKNQVFKKISLQTLSSVDFNCRYQLLELSAFKKQLVSLFNAKTWDVG